MSMLRLLRQNNLSLSSKTSNFSRVCQIGYRPLALRNLASTTMSSQDEPALHTFVIWAPDYTDKDAINRRLAIRPQHFADKAKEEERSKYYTKIFGPFLTAESIASPDATKKMIGSMLLVRAKSLDEVKAMVEKDVYWKNNVWDKEKIVIAPFLINTDL